jgi:hypothetical protein
MRRDPRRFDPKDFDLRKIDLANIDLTKIDLAKLLLGRGSRKRRPNPSMTRSRAEEAPPCCPN